MRNELYILLEAGLGKCLMHSVQAKCVHPSMEGALLQCSIDIAPSVSAFAGSTSWVATLNRTGLVLPLDASDEERCQIPISNTNWFQQG